MSSPKKMRLLRVACFASLASLALIVWSLIAEGPLAVVVSMSVGQALGTMALITFLAVVVADLRRGDRARVASLPPASEK